MRTQTLKAAFVLLLIAGISFWAVDSMRPQSYDGTNLTFAAGRGPVTVTNRSSDPIAVQLVTRSVRPFSVTGSADGMTGAAVKQGTGTSSTQVYAFSVPAGVSEFTVVRGTNSTSEINFVGDPDTRLEATAYPLSANDARTTLIVAGVLIIGALYYLSRLYGHPGWRALRGTTAPARVPAPLADMGGGQGTVARGYGDNRV